MDQLGWASCRHRGGIWSRISRLAQQCFGDGFSRRCFFAWGLLAVHMFTKWASARSTAWAERDCIELWDAACRMAGKPRDVPFEQDPQCSYHRRLKEAITKGKLAVRDG